ncbi:MAG: hypothetical protein OHK93_006898 [Ramalina farinacea]|uniref:NAD(P)-binding domain-containing protein n=1 Tax=Ramalina farinacea TaxID=258253 RepID=A0AA43QMW0_9LECA|nr:hypothetical protein [Ramalina farinacea]
MPENRIHHIDRTNPAAFTLSRPLNNILVLGGTGILGPHLLAHLSTDPQFILTTLTRSSSTPSSSPLPASIRTISISPSFPQRDLAAAVKGQDAIINLIPPFNLALHKRIIDTAIGSNVARYIPGEFALATHDPEVVAMVPGPFGAQAQIAEYLVQKTTMDEKEGRGGGMMTMTWTGICTGCFLDWGLQTGFLGFDLEKREATLYDSGQGVGDLTTLPDVCEAVRAVLKHASQETANRWVHVNTFRLTQAQILENLQTATDRREWTCRSVDSKVMNWMGNKKLGEGDFDGFQPAVLGLFWGGYESGRMDVEKDNELLLGRGTRSLGELDEVVRKVLDEVAT